ncbi:FtsX-like permease family protein [Spirosoma sp. HMF4905]|uniref:FtsX-like permease family protein n=1 Tax=Spirosoma arboris TaxID=2682092 RepID=A0A7K1SFP7_9BACT|nr:FtsX-like permease family protein [Spirosoma arboris]MVM32554.1 FtsX-like permease family protein [Spirosoma arboris]
MKPPRLADQLLKLICAPHRLEEVQGDLHEEFAYQVRHIGERRARWRYWQDVIGFISLFPIKRKVSAYPNPTTTAMLRNYLKIAFRNLARNKGYSAINIGGLAVGMAVAMLNGLWIWDELSFNKYHQNYDRIAQVVKSQTYRGEFGVGQTMVYPLSTELKTNYAKTFKHLVRASSVREFILSTGETKISSTGQFMDSDAPDMLSLNMIQGTRAGLNDLNTIMLSAKTAQALFGETDPLGKVISMNNKTQVKVVGVFDDLPLNTEFQEAKFLAPWSLFLTLNPWIEERAVHDWRNHFIRIYAEIPSELSFDQVSDRIKDAELKNLANFTEERERHPQVFLNPMSRWHLFPYGDHGETNKAPLQMVWLVGVIGAFVLLLACINFMNLSTARSEKRAKEVGIRKAVGSVRGQLISQFFSESFLVVTLALLIALLLVTSSLNWFNGLAAKQMTIPWGNVWFWAISLGFIFITGLLAGSYPALYLSSFQPVKVLKGTFRVGRFATAPRKVLVVVQFTVSVTLIISTIIVYRQIQFAKSRPVGYTREGLITMRMKSEDFYGKYDVLQDELKKTGVVSNMSQSMGPVTEVYSGNSIDWKGKDPNDTESFGTLAVTPEHGRTVGWQFVAGRDFSRDYLSDSTGMIINEAAAKYMGLKNRNGGPIIGAPVTWNWWAGDRPPLHYHILGIVKDMVMESPYEPIKPAVFYLKGHNGRVNWMSIRIKPGVAASEALPKIEAVLTRLIPSAPFDYKFVDEEYAKKFAAEDRISKLATFFAILAIFISCLGLFGLASFVAEQRTKEIGIRKVLGASVANLWQMLSKDFVLLVGISCLIAAPLAWYFMEQWLQKYPYRETISWWIFAVTGAGALAITLLTVSFQALKAALINPVKSLRSE